MNGRQVGSLKGLSVESDVLLPSCIVGLADACVYSNVTELAPEFGQHLRRDVYPARAVAMPPLRLGRLPPGSRVLAGGDFIVLAGDALLDTHVPPWVAADVLVPAQDDDVEDDGQDYIVVARYGVATWGHWLGELLPAVVAVERAQPGRFRYVMPSATLMPFLDRNIWVNQRESLALYGIHPDRILPIESDRTYRFRRLWATTDVVSDHMFHPGALDLMRCGAGMPLPGWRRVALLREENRDRSIVNSEEIAALLAARGFEFVQPGRTGFAEQVGMFQQAAVVVGVLGSDLSGLIYAPYGVRVASLAPAAFGDRFFYAMIQLRAGHYADLRGASADDAALERDRSFAIDPEVLQQGLDALGI